MTGTGESVSVALASSALTAAAAAGAPAEAEDPDAACSDPPALVLEVDEEDDAAWLRRGGDSATDLRGQRWYHEARSTTLAESASTPACPSLAPNDPPPPGAYSETPNHRFTHVTLAGGFRTEKDQAQHEQEAQ